MRLNYSEDEDFPGQFWLWQANCRRSLQSRAGQRELRELEAALLELPEKRLIHGALQDEHGGVCAIACYAKRKGVDLSKFDQEYDSPEVGEAAGMPRLVAWKIVSLNDIEIEDHYEMCEGPNTQPASYDTYRHGVWTRFEWTPEERYAKVLAWVRSSISEPSEEP